MQLLRESDFNRQLLLGQSAQQQFKMAFKVGRGSDRGFGDTRIGRNRGSFRFDFDANYVGAPFHELSRDRLGVFDLIRQRSTSPKRKHWLDGVRSLAELNLSPLQSRTRGPSAGGFHALKAFGI